MLGIEGYGSGSDNESDNEAPQVAKPLESAKKSTLSLPPPSATTSKISRPPRPKRAPKKIAIGLPNFPGDGDDDADDLKDERPATKKLKLDSRAGVSSLLSMLPAPKQNNSKLPPPERVLGGGKGPGLIFDTHRPATPAATHEDTTNDEPDNNPHVPEEAITTSVPFLPPSLGKGRSNISVEEGKPITQVRAQKPTVPPVDFFSLGAPFYHLLYLYIR